MEFANVRRVSARETEDMSVKLSTMGKQSISASSPLLSSKFISQNSSSGSMGVVIFVMRGVLVGSRDGVLVNKGDSRSFTIVSSMCCLIELVRGPRLPVYL